MTAEINNLGDLVNSLNIVIEDDDFDMVNQIYKDKFPYIDKEVLKLLGVKKIGDRILLLDEMKKLDKKAKGSKDDLITELSNSFANDNLLD